MLCPLQIAKSPEAYGIVEQGRRGGDRERERERKKERERKRERKRERERADNQSQDPGEKLLAIHVLEYM